MTQPQTVVPDLTYAPAAPKSIAETGIAANALLNLMLKSVYVNGLETTSEIKDKLGLSHRIVATLLEDGADKGLFEILGKAGTSALADLRHSLTSKGKEWAVEALNHSQYVGPAPVTLEAYHRQAGRQRVSNEPFDRETLADCFSHLVVPDDLVRRLGPALNSGRSILFYGPPGNGKSTVAQAIGAAFSQTIFVPYCIDVDGHVIKIFDSTVHVEALPEAHDASSLREGRRAGIETYDRRWARCRRPVVITGGELTLQMLDLRYDPSSKYYEAPMQLKATNGVFVVDDFGRQMVSPGEVLNRWIIPLEQGRDYLTLHTGKQFAVPFDEVVIFSTNFEPKDFMDAATMRRIQYKMLFEAPSEAEYATIFRNVCRDYGVELPADLLSHLDAEFYGPNQPRARYHPKWIVEQVTTRCAYEGQPPRLDRQMVMDALRNLDTAF